MDCKLSSGSRFFSSKFLNTSDYNNLGVDEDISPEQYKKNFYSKTRSVLNNYLRDLLYVDDLTDEEIAVCLLKRYLNHKYFTYFGNVLFYTQPLDIDPLYEHSRFLYSEESKDSHLYYFLKEVFITFIKDQYAPNKLNAIDSKDRTLVTKSSGIIDTEVDTKSNNFNVFFYGDNHFGQTYSTQKSLLFLTQFAHSLGLEPTGTFYKKVSNVLKLLENMSDYNSNSKLCNYMSTYKMGFNESNYFTSLTVVPNFSTDLSCSVVTNTFRKFLSEHLTNFFPDLKVRFPSLFYGLLYSLSKEQNLQWFSECRLSPYVASIVLERIPSHEVVDPNYHIVNFSKLMDIFLMVGFTVDELKYCINILCSVVLLDLYSILKNTNLDRSPSSSSVDGGNTPFSSGDEHSTVQDSSTDSGSSKSGAGSSSDEGRNKRIYFCGKDLLDMILDILDIDILYKPNSDLEFNDSLFKLEMSSQTLSPVFDNLSAALYLRFKHYVNSKINEYLVLDPREQLVKSLSLHCNSGFNPYSNFIKLSDYHLAWYSSEEFFMNWLFKTFFCGLKGSLESEFISRNNEFVTTSTSKDGLLTKIVLETISYKSDESLSSFDRNVQHSWKDFVYNIPNVIKIDSTLYTVSPLVRSLFKYSKNQVLSSLLFSTRSLHPIVGNCASSLSYNAYLNGNLEDSERSYVVACFTPFDFGKNNYTDRFNLLKFEKIVTVILSSLVKKIPLLDICNAQKAFEVHSVSLSEYSRKYMPLLYMFTNSKYHSSLPLLKEEQVVQLLFSLLSVSERMYCTENGVLTIRKSLYVKMQTLLNDYMERHLGPLVKLQRWWKDHRMPLVKTTLVNLVVRVQSLSRMNNLRKVSKLTREGRRVAYNFIGLVATCFHVNGCLKFTTNKTLQLLLNMEKEFHEKEYDHLQHSAATYIQSIWRGSIERKKYSLVKQDRFEEFSIILIQSCIRRVLSCSEILNVRNTKTIKATMIQSYFRGYLARKKYRNLMQLKLLLLPILKKGSKINSMTEQINFIKLYKDHDSVSIQMKRLISVQTNLPSGFVKVQNLVRMHFVRKQYLYLKSCLEKVHALAMTKTARLSYLEKVKAAVKIQRWWRCLPKDSFPSINSNAIYYINLKEQKTISLLSNELRNLDVSVFHFNIHQDIRRVYPNTWAMLPLSFIKNIKLMQKSSADLNYTQTRKIEYVKFAVGSTHSLMLIATNNGSCVYSWGWNDKGQLGRRNLYPLKSSETDFTLMDPLEFHDETGYKDKLYEELSDRVSIVEIACGNDFSLAMSSNGRVYSWGDNTFGQCGQGSRLIRVHDPKPLDLFEVDSICCASYHSIVSVLGEYYVFGNAFERKIFKPMNLKTFVPHIRNQTIQKIKCSGSTTLLYTQELDYVLNVFTNLNNFQSMYNLKGSIKSFCTNGKMICAVVEIFRGEYQNADTKIYIFGQIRCVVSQDKNNVGGKNLLVGAFREKFENIGKKKTKQSYLNVYSTHGNTCFLQYPTEVVFQKVPIDVYCDHEQLIFTTNTGIYGAKIFQILSENASDFEILDNCTIDIKEGCNIKLEPSLYQFTNITKKRPTIYISSNSLSHSIGYTF